MASTAAELEAEIRDVLIPVAATWRLAIDDDQVEAFVAYGLELLRWNEAVNLTRITEPRAIVVRHFLDSLACATAFEDTPASLADIGTGAGFPGIPLKIIWPDVSLMLSDSVGKKTAFLTHVVALLGLTDVEVVTARAEELGRDARHREQYQGVVARAVAALDVLSEYALPLCRLGGCFVAPKGGDGAAEADSARRAIGRLGGELKRILPVTLPEVEPRTLVVVDKVRPTPRDLPRPVGVPSKRPL